MKNKKGFSIIKTILWIAFFAFVILFIYSTFKAIHDKNNQITESNTDLRLIEDNSTYNPLRDIFGYSILGYNTASVSASSTSNNVLNYENYSSAYFLAKPTSDTEAFYNINSGYYPSSLFNINNVIFNDNRISLSSSLTFNNFRTYFFDRNYFSSTLNPSRSYIMYYECQIPVDYFSFTMYYNFPLSSSKTIRFIVMTENGYSTFNFSFSTSQKYYTFSSDVLRSAIPGSNNVLRFGFCIAQSSNNTNASYYLPQNDSSNTNTNGFNYVDSTAYMTYYNSLSTISDKNSLCYLLFSESSFSQQYQEGFNNGYNEGINYNQGYINSLSNQINSLNDLLTELRTTTNTQSQIIAQLQAQLNQQQNNYKDFFFTFVDIPIKTMHDVLNFDFFGLNLFRFFTGVLTALGAIWLIKKFI